jgi:glycosyltransferase involved in cell wall biosynthesis
MKRIVVVGALPESLINFRGDLIKFLSKNDFEVVAMSNPTSVDNVIIIEQLGAKFESYKVNRHNINPIVEFKTFINILIAIKRLKPDYVLAYTIKPVVWVGLAMYLLRDTKFIALIEGLGYAFQPGGLKRKLIKKVVSIFYKIALFNSKKVIFLNNDNKEVFVNNKIVDLTKCSVIDGIGVNLNHYKIQDFPNLPFKVLMISRFLNEKGVREYIKAAEIIKIANPNIEIKLLGNYDDSSDSVPFGIIEEAVNKNIIEVLPPSSDIRPNLKNCHLFVLPSYHEGMPRTIMEAMATGRPILTTNVSGCKDTVKDSQNGLLVEKQDSYNLAKCILWFSNNIERTIEMGMKSREIAEKRFDVNKINAQILSIINSI